MLLPRSAPRLRRKLSLRANSTAAQPRWSGRTSRRRSIGDPKLIEKSSEISNFVCRLFKSFYVFLLFSICICGRVSLYVFPFLIKGLTFRKSSWIPFRLALWVFDVVQIMSNLSKHVPLHLFQSRFTCLTLHEFHVDMRVFVGMEEWNAETCKQTHQP